MTYTEAEAHLELEREKARKEWDTLGADEVTWLAFWNGWLKMAYIQALRRIDPNACL